MMHRDVLALSFKHRFEIKKAVKDILGYLGIIHFSLDLVSPKGEMLIFSSTPSHCYEVCTQGYGGFDATISKEYFENQEFYWWHEVKHHKFAKEIEYIKKVRHGFKRGFMLVRRWDDFYLIYSFASDNAGHAFIDQVESNLDTLFEMGDYVYNALRDVYFNYTDGLVPPVVSQYYKYIGGKPEKRSVIAPKSSSKLILPSHYSSGSKPDLRIVVDND